MIRHASLGVLLLAPYPLAVQAEEQEGTQEQVEAEDNVTICVTEGVAKNGDKDLIVFDKDNPDEEWEVNAALCVPLEAIEAECPMPKGYNIVALRVNNVPPAAITGTQNIVFIQFGIIELILSAMRRINDCQVSADKMLQRRINSPIKFIYMHPFYSVIRTVQLQQKRRWITLILGIKVHVRRKIHLFIANKK